MECELLPAQVNLMRHELHGTQSVEKKAISEERKEIVQASADDAIVMSKCLFFFQRQIHTNNIFHIDSPFFQRSALRNNIAKDRCHRTNKHTSQRESLFVSHSRCKILSGTRCTCDMNSWAMHTYELHHGTGTTCRTSRTCRAAGAQAGAAHYGFLGENISNKKSGARGWLIPILGLLKLPCLLRGRLSQNVLFCSLGSKFAKKGPHVCKHVCTRT